MSMNRCVRVSSSVDLVPSRAATSDCTLSSSCSSSALNASSFLAKAYVSLPVVGLILVGGVTPSMLSMSANFGFDMRSPLSSMPASTSSCSLRSRTATRCASSWSLSNSSVGLVNMRSVKSINFSSLIGNLALIFVNRSNVRFTSLMQ